MCTRKMTGKPADARKVNNMHLIISVPKRRSPRKFEKHIERNGDENTKYPNMWKINLVVLDGKTNARGHGEESEVGDLSY